MALSLARQAQQPSVSTTQLHRIAALSKEQHAMLVHMPGAPTIAQPVQRLASRAAQPAAHLLYADGVQHALLVNVLGQRQLHQDAVHVGVRVVVGHNLQGTPMSVGVKRSAGGQSAAAHMTGNCSLVCPPQVSKKAIKTTAPPRIEPLNPEVCKEAIRTTTAPRIEPPSPP